MTTIISTFYDALVTKIEATWTTAAHIADALSVENAPSTILQDGYAIAIGPGIGGGEQSCQERFTREIMIIRTLLISSTENEATKMGTSIKNLLESHYDLRAALRLDNTLSGSVSDIGYVSDGGIELLSTPDAAGRYHLMASVYTVTYIENLY